MPRKTKRMFFECDVPPRFKITSFKVKIPLLNTNFSRFLYVLPDAEITKDEFDNLYAEFTFEQIRDFLFVEYGFEEIKDSLPRNIFRSVDELADYYSAPDYDVHDITAMFRSGNLSIRELSSFIRENFDLRVDNHICEHYSKIAALVAELLGYRCASVSGYLNESDLKSARINSLGETFTFPSFTGHKWTLINKGNACYIADPAVIPQNGERRFIEAVNSNTAIGYSFKYAKSRLGNGKIGFDYKLHVELDF